MRTSLVVIGFGCVALVHVACGGNVVVDGTTTTSTGGSMNSASRTAAAPVCTNLTGEQLTNGGCQSDAQCNTGTVHILCNPTAPVSEGGGPSSCGCQVNGSQVGTCQEVPGSSTLCNPTNGCCSQFFGG